jgi:hypothetical protein
VVPDHRYDVRLVALLVLICLVACAPDPGDVGPVEALTSFLAAIERSTYTPDQRKQAFE